VPEAEPRFRPTGAEGVQAELKTAMLIKNYIAQVSAASIFLFIGKAKPMNLRNLEHALLTLGLTLCTASLGVLAYREVGSRMAIRSFEAGVSGRGSIQAPAPTFQVGVAPPDYSLWSPKRIAAYRDSLARQFAPAVAILRILKLGVEVAVFEGTDELVLNRGVGRVVGSSRVGESGNIGIAGHRDGFFRMLKDIAVGDIMTLSSPSATTTYSVDQIEIVTPNDVSVLAPRAGPSVTLVTCYPFYYLGDAPRRFIVHGIQLAGTVRPGSGAN
jgi:sortase A